MNLKADDPCFTSIELQKQVHQSQNSVPLVRQGEKAREQRWDGMKAGVQAKHAQNATWRFLFVPEEAKTCRFSPATPDMSAQGVAIT
ncbi:hypothetical protein SKAU_G00147100 [Synaphobranchus kaupii]|uniref:Uncharacterized protein n=1 Tax=Synaphobranchus kaupii TaxID=118154 RepID=A0A9Q1FTS2_SYNKA|nr:hypothetical protein SKAU_G00147100 [Synaphobranchus kaupii]